MSSPNDPQFAVPVYNAPPPNQLSQHISTATTTLVKTGAGVFFGFNVNTGGAGSTITAYDSLTGSGTVLGVWSGATPGSVLVGLNFTTGLTIVTTATAPDLTIKYQ